MGGYPPPAAQHPLQRPNSSGHQYAPPQFNGAANGYAHHMQPHHYPPPLQATAVHPGRPLSSEDTPRPRSSGQPNGQQTPAARLPSPIINRPVITPSQGNYDVGPVAGIQNHPAPQALPNGTPTPNLVPRNAHVSSSPPLSGVSPVKHSPSAPPSVSGTPVFPPAAKLAPSPERGPQPTPSKQGVQQDQ